MKTKLIGGVVVFVIALGFTGYALGFFGKHESPTQMLSKAFSADQYSDKSAVATIDIKKKKLASDTTYSDLGDFTVNISQKVNKENLAESSAKISFDGYALMNDSGSPFSKIDVAGDMLMANKVFYIRATKIPASLYFGITGMSNIKDKWWSVDLVSMARQFGGEDKAKEIQTYFDNAFAKKDEDMKAISSIFEKNNFVVNPVFTNTETINGHSVKDISFTINKKILVDFLYNLGLYENKKNNVSVTDEKLAAQKDSTSKLLDSVTFAPIVVGISPDDYHIYKISSSIEAKDPSYNPNDPSAFEVINANFSATYDYTTPIVIDVPTDSQPIEMLLSQIFGR